MIQLELPVYQLMLRHPGWQRVFEGNSFGVFVRLDKYTGNYVAPSLDKKYYQETLMKTDIKF